MSASVWVPAGLMPFPTSQGIDIVKAGADPTGVNDISDILVAACATGLPVFGYGKFRIAKPCIIDLGQNIGTNSDGYAPFSLTLQNVVPDAGIGAAITLANVRRPQINISAVGGGNESANDIFFNFYNVEGGRFDIKGSDYRGLLVNFDGTQGIWLEQTGGTIWARFCYKAFSFVGPVGHNTGTGRMDMIWDVLPSQGPTLQNMDDVSIGGYENTIIAGVFAASNTFSIVNCTSFHGGKISLGKAGVGELVLSGGTNLTIDELYVFGGNTPGVSTTIGLQAYNCGLVSIGQLSAIGLLAGMDLSGNANLQVGIYKGLNNINDVILRQVLGSAAANNLSIENYFSQNAYQESLKTVGTMSGKLEIDGGTIRTGNIGAATTSAMDTSSSLGGLSSYVSNLTIDNAYGTSITTYNRAAFYGRDNNLQGAIPIVDSFGSRGSIDGKSFLITVAAIVFATPVVNANAFNIDLYVPLIFKSGATIADFAQLDLIDLSGTTRVRIARITMQATLTADTPETLHAVIPAGWTYNITVSGANVILDPVNAARSIKL